MSRSFGLVGLPNAGKSTIFNALTLAGAKVEAYPFCTIEPHHGVAAVPDERLDRLHRLFPTKKKVPTTIEVVDIAGLVEGACQGEGLGNQFLAEIRGVEAILHVVRCFSDPDIAHPMGEPDVRRDVAVVEGELLAKDKETLERRRERSAKVARTGDKAAQEEVAFLDRLLATVKEGKPIRALQFSSHDQPLLRELAPLTAKPVLFVANVGDDGENDLARALAALAQENGAGWIAVRGKLEAELGEACPDERERQAFLREYGLAESALVRLVAEAYRLLSVITFYTVEGPEVRAWTIPAGTRAPDAGAAIHTDFRDRFVLAEVMHLPDLLAAGSERALREAGKIHRAGRDYIVQDGDVIHFISA
ncbi:MAG: GTP-binding and nucleic acid-binding protein YchF [Candidatus Bipolaricaulis sibiricus]|uniref:GTP-binding and nucleic acid-binding protein YchF n=1 Tax=Bipolaricaulis sibiricus TaxID=2501609 RepID=A0A410FSY7_BIPS1|nr:MAG: GTP-binding and nucleic acid-binding protein YchF [Candidatus Bipolaricaulis sibiricus]